MKKVLVGIGIHLAAVQALARSKDFEVVEVDTAKAAPAHPHNDEFSREFRQRQKAQQRKQLKKPARGGGKP
jgi:hypothetical protein